MPLQDITDNYKRITEVKARFAQRIVSCRIAQLSS